MNENVIRLMVDGQEVVLDVAADMAIGDLTSEMDAIAAKIAWYGRVLGAVERHGVVLDGQYRQWRAVESSSILAGDPKLAEYKVRLYVEARPKFLQYKEMIGMHEELHTRLVKALIALQVKADMLRSRGARDRLELQTTSMATFEAPGDSQVVARRGRDTRETGPGELREREMVDKIRTTDLRQRRGARE